MTPLAHLHTGHVADVEVRVQHVTDDHLEALAFSSGALIDLGGTYPTAHINGVRYVASLVDVPLVERAS